MMSALNALHPIARSPTASGQIFAEFFSLLWSQKKGEQQAVCACRSPGSF